MRRRYSFRIQNPFGKKKVKAFTLVKTIRDSLQTLLLHQQFTETARDFFKAVRSRNYAEAKSRMSPAWQGVSTGELRDMIQNDLPLLPLSTASNFGLAMDDGTSAVLDAYLFFDGGHWIWCGISLMQEEGRWSIDALNLRLEDWSPEKLQQQPDLESRSVDMSARLAG